MKPPLDKGTHKGTSSGAIAAPLQVFLQCLLDQLVELAALLRGQDSVWCANSSMVSSFDSFIEHSGAKAQ